MITLGLAAVMIITPIYPALAMALWMGQHEKVNIYTLLAVCLMSATTIILLSGFLHILAIGQAQYAPSEYCEKYIINQKEVEKVE